MAEYIEIFRNIMAQNRIAGRREEMMVLQQALESEDAEFIAVYGRRRVGKTYLIREFFEKQLCLEIIGSPGGGLKDQLFNFSMAMEKTGWKKEKGSPPGSWAEAFIQLEEFLASFNKSRKGKIAVFMDELPWLNTQKSGFLPALQHFWNRYGNKRRDLILIVCGSAASWMIQHVIRSKGGLHNRLTRQIRLLPFTLSEMKEYLAKRNVKNIGDYQLMQLYMAFGGVPYYLNFIGPGLSASQIIDRVCFSGTGPLRNEFDLLYQSLFDKSSTHIKIVEGLAASRNGANRSDILKYTGLQSGGTVTKVIDELTESGFIDSYIPFGKKSNDLLYRLTDEFSLFYLKWMKPLGKHSPGEGYWLSKQSGQSYRSWAGYAFESICMKHVNKLKAALGISGIETQSGTWRYTSVRGSDLPGVQIDLLIDRKDGVINLCEMKFYEAEFIIDAAYSKEIRQKIHVFRSVTGTRKNIYPVLVTPFGVVTNKYSLEMEITDLRIDVFF